MDQTLQNLPPHLVQQIARRATRWVTPTTKGRLPSTSNPSWKMQKYINISQRWHFSCIPLYCQQAVLSTNATASCIDERHHWSSTTSAVYKLNGNMYTRHVHINVPFTAIADGTMARLLNQAPYANMCFPRCEAFWFKPTRGHPTTVDAAHWTDNIREFVQCVHRMFPNARMCGISSAVSLAENDHAVFDHIGELFTQLIQLSTSVSYFASSEHLFPARLVHTLGLTSIAYTECASSALFVCLIRANHATLQELHIEATQPNVLAHIVAHPTPISFPYLSVLDAECLDFNPDFVPTYAPTHAPFPRLCSLTLHHPYPFTTRALFAHNKSTLHRVSLHIQSTHDALFYVQSKVVDKHSLPQVTQLDIRVTCNESVWDKYVGRTTVAAFVECAPRVQHLQLNIDCVGLEPSVRGYITHTTMANIRYLKIGHTALSISDVVQVLERVPNVVQLGIDPQTIDPTTHTRIQDTQSLDHLHSLIRTYPHLGKRLNHIVFGLATCADMEGSAHFAIQLAILCRHTTRIRWSTHSSLFVDHCTRLSHASESPYAAYTHRLRTLDWKKNIL
ncbi:hypothetical protein LPJ77_004158 [Coemansia sp. RSA 2523]|nr:hypothetical protein LPJ77_004158 [Coemansia sp. RSA 2523]KAJ2536444.1 hypothetical protein IWW43_000843 [Coemansia sp. RSA 1935]